MTFTLSVGAMMRHAYARSAMIWLAAPAETKPVPLQPDHAPALRELLRGACAELCLHLLPMVKSTNFDTFDPDGTDPFLVIELDLPGDMDAPALRAALEHAVALTALRGALTSASPAIAAEAGAVASEASGAKERLVRLARQLTEASRRSAAATLRIRPCYL